ncbi:hypothetical protein MRB53_014114 [Persea americana]|uniref:Uncharacterized protein n=1 Tax=Persea americana TaxID=3435 RepID=A0ACC2KA39_PERAE|nr:hypothetical protein MRB53_014114 [Persea americana]
MGFGREGGRRKGGPGLGEIKTHQTHVRPERGKRGGEKNIREHARATHPNMATEWIWCRGPAPTSGGGRSPFAREKAVRWREWKRVKGK